MLSSKSVAVIGAGITGVTTAYQLQQRGFKVTLIDAERYAAMKTSFANGGQLSASNAEVWTHWATILHGLQWLFKKDAPLSLSLMPSWHKYSWLLEFLANMPNYRKHTIKTVELALKARTAFFEMADQAGLEFNSEKRGILHFYEDRAGFEKAQKVTKILAKGGLQREELDPTQITNIEPTLSGSYYGGFFTESDTTGDIHKFSTGLADAFERAGGVFLTGKRVQRLGRDKSVEFEDGSTLTFDAVVVSAGVGSKKLASQVGDRVNIYPVKGYSITVNLTDEASQKAAPWVSLLDDDAKIVTSRLGKDRFRVAGTAEINGYGLDIREDRIQPLVRWCEHHFPAMSTEDVVPWAGLRPMMPSMMPRVGKGRVGGIYYNTGHGHLGWTLSAATAEIIADQVAADLHQSAASVLPVASADSSSQLADLAKAA